MIRSVFVTLLLVSSAFGQSQRWTEQAARDWYARQPWLVGANYIPSTAINELEMWQAETFDPKRIDTELAWAESIGMNTMRVFLHDLLWKQDAAGYQEADRYVPGHRREAQHSPYVRIIRFVLGPVS